MSSRIEIIIPMAGEGQRFKDAGYVEDKPFIPVYHNIPMISAVIQNLRPLSVYMTFLVKPDHQVRMEKLIEGIGIQGRCISVPKHSDGSVGTVLFARNRIAPEVPVIIANCDQLVEYGPVAWEVHLSQAQGHSIWCFRPADHPKWSYAKVQDGIVVQVAEKNPISDIATVGVYYWASWADYLWAADQMIAKGLRVNSEFYNCPLYNEVIERGDIVRPFFPGGMIGLGTPEDLEAYIGGTHEDCGAIDVL